MSRNALIRTVLERAVDAGSYALADADERWATAIRARIGTTGSGLVTLVPHGGAPARQRADE